MSFRCQVSRWQSDLTLQFVKAYLRYECLWNPKHKDYRNKKMKEKSYSLIIHDLKDSIKLDVNKVKFKIRSLRTTYSQEVTKMIRNSTNPDRIYESSLIWFDIMDDCLKEIVTPRMPQTQSNTSDWKGKWDEDSVSNSDEERDITFLQDDPLPVTDPITETTDSNHKPNTRLSDNSTQSVNDKVPEDEYDSYGRYIAAQLRKLPLEDALKTKMDILNIISKARLRADTQSNS